MTWLAAADAKSNALMKELLADVLTVDSNCVDIGACQGEVLSDMVRLAPEGRHIAYEPLPEMFSRLANNFSSVDVRQAAVADRNGETTFVHVIDAPAWSGLRRSGIPLSKPALEEFRVRMVRLDDDLPADYVPALIKIDVQGAELQTIEGALRTISVHKPTILFEHGHGARAYGTTPDQIFEQLCSRCGLQIFSLRGGPALTLEEFRASKEWNFVARA